MDLVGLIKCIHPCECLGVATVCQYPAQAQSDLKCKSQLGALVHLYRFSDLLQNCRDEMDENVLVCLHTEMAKVLHAACVPVYCSSWSPPPSFPPLPPHPIPSPCQFATAFDADAVYMGKKRTARPNEKVLISLAT